MKKLIIAILFLVLTSGLSFAGGGQNTNRERGASDSGKTYTGSNDTSDVGARTNKRARGK